MALLTSRAIYGLQAMIVLAKQTDLISSQALATQAKIPKNYSDQLLAKMREAKLVESVRGVNGGYRLAKEPSLISIWEILEALEDGVRIISDATGNYALNLLFQEKQKQLAKLFEISLADMQEYESAYLAGLHYSI